MVKNPPSNTGNIRVAGSIAGSGRSPGGGNGNPLQYSCLGNPMDREAWCATVHGSQRVRVDLATEHHHHSTGGVEREKKETESIWKRTLHEAVAIDGASLPQE